MCKHAMIVPDKNRLPSSAMLEHDPSNVLAENDTSTIPILRVEDLSIRLPDKRVLFEHVSLELAEGEIVCLPRK